MGEKPKLNNQKQKTSLMDSLGKKVKEESFSDWQYFQDNLRKKSSIFFTKRGVLRSFYTDHSKLYFTPEEYRMMRRGEGIWRPKSQMDALYPSITKRSESSSSKKEDRIFLSLQHRYSNLRTYFGDLFQGATRGVSVAKVWNLSIVGAVIFGMFSMTMVYRYLGQNVSAKIQEKENIAGEESGQVLGAKDYDINEEIDTEYITRILEDAESGEEIKQKDFEKEILAMVKGYPIEKMIPEIVKQDRIVAAFLVAIAKKESNWGKRVPVLDGQDCYNYWGYRGIRDRMGTGGHTCFDSPKDAVETVGKRIAYLVSETKRNTPDKMVVWKCGYDCSWDNKLAVKKWISDVDLYFQQLNKE